jgi:glyoxylate/hydroxypyruvate reductase
VLESVLSTRALKIVLYAGNDGPTWVRALRRALPEAETELWSATEATDADYGVVWKPPPDVMPSFRRARAIFNLGAGVDAIADLGHVLPGIPLIRLNDAGMAEQMIEYVAHAALRCYREVDAYAGQQRDALWRARPRKSKREFVIGILGAGVLGAAVAEALVRLGFAVRAWSRSRKDIAGVTSFAGDQALAAFLAETRFLACLLPLTRDTENLLDRERLALLPRGAYVVNVARGGLVVDTDLLALLDNGHLAGAILDVFRDEPLPAAHPFWHHPRVTVTPHVSAATLVQESVQQIADKIRRFDAGLPITGVVDRDRGY